MSLSGSSQPAAEFYKLINQTSDCAPGFGFGRENKDYSGRTIQTTPQGAIISVAARAFVCAEEVCVSSPR